MSKRNADLGIEQISKLVRLVETYELAELTVEEEGFSITIKGHSQNVEQVTTSSPSILNTCNLVVSESQQIETLQEDHEDSELEGEIIDIVAPLVGVFYRAPAPDAPPFVEVGDHIEVGTEIGLIEAMKVFSPIPSDVAGKVVEIPAENGKLVQKGEVLVRVRVEK
ncbi:MAG: acetyl-CoA carboxylase [Armatimonadota bacterium]